MLHYPLIDSPTPLCSFQRNALIVSEGYGIALEYVKIYGAA